MALTNTKPVPPRTPDKTGNLFIASEYKNKRQAIKALMDDNDEEGDVHLSPPKLPSLRENFRNIEREMIRRSTNMRQYKREEEWDRKQTRERFRSLYKSTAAQIKTARDEEVGLICAYRL